jgi:hypothetical protein
MLKFACVGRGNNKTENIAWDVLPWHSKLFYVNPGCEVHIDM